MLSCFFEHPPERRGMERSPDLLFRNEEKHNFHA